MLEEKTPKETETTTVDVPTETAKPTKFGFGQLSNPTPKWAKVIFRIFFYATGIATVILDIFTEIPMDVKLMINSGVIKANLLVHAVSKMFGVDISEFSSSSFRTAAPLDQEVQNMRNQ